MIATVTATSPPTAPPPDRGRWIIRVWLLTLLTGLVAGAGYTVWSWHGLFDGWQEDDSVRAVLAEQVAAWNAGDLERFMRTYWQDDGLRFYSGGTVTGGWQATLDRYRKRYQADGKEMGTLTFTDLEVESLGPDAALARGRWGLVFRKSDDKPSGLFTLVLRKKADGWRIVHDHTSAADPPKKD
jgi:beta-aspartyl-peptidase (threonine type)